jgi:hypothetical protein
MVSWNAQMETGQSVIDRDKSLVPLQNPAMLSDLTELPCGWQYTNTQAVLQQ